MTKNDRTLMKEDVGAIVRLVPKTKDRLILRVGGSRRGGRIRAKKIRMSLSAYGFEFGRGVYHTLANMPRIKKETELDVAFATVKVIGDMANEDFSDGACYDEICRAIKKIGELCPPEVAPAFCRKIANYSFGEWQIAMKPIKDRHYLNLFSIAQDSDGRWLDVVDGRTDTFWEHDDVFVFLWRSSKRKV